MYIEKRKAFLVNFTYFGTILAVAYLLLRYALPLVAPFAIAFVIAYILNKPIQFLKKKFHIPRNLIAILIVALFYAIAGALLILISVKAVSAVGALISILPALYENHALPYFTEILLNIEIAFMGMDPGMSCG